MNFVPETTPEAFHAEACRWSALYAAPLARHIRPHGNVPDPERRVKIGYVSPDLYNHAVMRFMPPLTITNEEMDAVIAAIRAAVRDMRTMLPIARAAARIPGVLSLLNNEKAQIALFGFLRRFERAERC